ncbi:MAG TPA: glycosyltransferase family 39 protein [Actinomycetes bacterium]
MTAGRVDQRPAVEAEPRPAEGTPASPPPIRRGWLADHWPSLLLLLGLLVVVAAVQATGMTHAPQRADDEGTYVAQAWAVLHWHTLAHYTYWYDHPPLGWLLLAAWAGVTGAFTRAASAVAAGRELTLVAQLASAALLFGLARRLGLRRLTAALGVLLFSLSPLALSYHRAVYLDNLATPFVLAAFLLVLSPRHRLAAHAAAGLSFAAAVLCKETSLLLLPALLWQYWEVSDPRTRRYSLALAGSLFALVVFAFPLYALLRGELLPGPEHVSLADAVRFQLAGRTPSGSLLDPTSGSRRTLGLWLGLDPWLLGAAVLLLPAGLAIRRLRPVSAAFASLAVMVLRPGYLPVPLVIGMLPFASLVVAGVADAALRRPWRPRHLAGQADLPGGLPGAVRPAVVAACLALAVAAVVAPQWLQRDRDLVTVDHDLPFRQAEAWIGANVPVDARLLVDDAVWVDLVRRGRPAEQVVWFYKLDTDRQVKARYPHGWRDFDYVMSSASLRGFPDSLPQVAEALRNSRVVASFGRGGGRVEVRRVQRPPP